MSPRTVERVDDWDTVPFGGGYGGLRDLASQEFSGVVTAGPTRSFMIRGTVVGVLDGSIDDFEDAGGSAREAPHPALPLLAVMQERSDEVRAKYYTEDTPLSDVDRTLEDGSFTGYVELSENVLSGDYYQIYHQGRSMSVAYVGSSGRLITDDEAFEQADDEVGIYEVRPVEIDAIDVPESADDAAGSTDAGPDPTESNASNGSNDAGSTTAGTDVDEAVDDATQETESGDDAGSPAEETDHGSQSVEDGTDGRPGQTGAGTADAPAEATDRSAADSPSGRQESPSTDDRSTGGEERPADTGTTHAGASTETTESATETAASAGGGRPASDDAASTDRPTPGTARQTGTPTGPEDGDQATSSVEAAADLEVRSIPSLDPSRSEVASKTTSAGQSGGRVGGSARSSRSQQSPQGQRSSTGSTDRTSAQQAPDESPGQSNQRSAGQQSDQPAEKTAADQQSGGQEADRPPSSAGDDASDLESELSSRERELQDLRTDLERVEAERDELERTRTELEAERDRLQAELEESRAEVERLTGRLEDFAEEGAGAAEIQLSAAEAIDDTNLFVRYRSKGDATLESAHAGDADRTAVAENMRLEYHTQFDAGATAVGNEPFDDFLTETIQYRFVDWVIGSLLYEIRDTGHADGMTDLYNALPKIDRAELNGQVSVNYTEGDEEHRSQERFDVVVRDRMGNPLVVANINNSRDPATDSMMTDLVKRAERVGESSESLAGAFLVTESFFEPEALETAEGATSSGLFSRDKRKSFVNLSRKGGYHLCLVEARNREFHLAVPEL